VVNPYHAGTLTRPDAPRFARRTNVLNTATQTALALRSPSCYEVGARYWAGAEPFVGQLVSKSHWLEYLGRIRSGPEMFRRAIELFPEYRLRRLQKAEIQKEISDALVGRES
jgi:hypothetical protein